MEWMNTKDNLPKYDRLCLVTLIDTRGKISIKLAVYHHYVLQGYDNEDWYVNHHLVEKCRVLAWMYAPDPYEPTQYADESAMRSAT